MTTKKKSPTKPIPVRLNEAQIADLKRAAGALRMSEADALRMAFDIGVEHLKKINFKLAKAVLRASEAI